MKRFLIWILVLGVAVPSVGFSAQKQGKKKTPAVSMYKCKDVKGRTYYADKPGPECAGSVQELTRQGMRVNRQTPGAGTSTSPAVSPDRQRRDKALLATYSTEEQVEAAKQRSLELPLQAIKQLEAKLERARGDLQALQLQAEGYASQKKQIPAALLDDVRSKQTLVAKLEQELAAKRAHATDIAQRFDADKQRFRELTGKQAAAR
jgi:hypothetical protein